MTIFNYQDTEVVGQSFLSLNARQFGQSETQNTFESEIYLFSMAVSPTIIRGNHNLQLALIKFWIQKLKPGSIPEGGVAGK